MKTLESERLILRNWLISDLDDLHEFASNKKVADLAGFKIKNSKEDSLKTLQSFITNSNDSLWEVELKELDKLVVWAIELKGLNRVVGWIELCKDTGESSQETFRYSKEIGFTLAQEHWGKGLMPEAIRRILNYLLNEEEIDAVVCSHFTNNSQSEKAIKKCGFKLYLEDNNEKYYRLTKLDTFTMKNLKVALLQLMPEDTLDGNIQKGLKYCRKSKEMGADIALFPEMWSVGYNIPEDIAELKASAVSANSAFVNSFGKLAKDLNMAIGITFLEKYDPLPRNTFCLFDRFGNNVLTYAKVHTCDFGDECRLTAGDDFYVAGLDTAQGNVKIGSMICYDREFPESARILMLKGAEIILVPNACPMEINRISQLRARAYENMVGIATVNYPKGKPDCNGHSSAFDGIAYRPTDFGSRDTLIIEAGEREGIYIADFPIDEIREYRSREVHGNAYRRPQKYKLLISESIEEPFIRKDYR